MQDTMDVWSLDPTPTIERRALSSQKYFRAELHPYRRLCKKTHEIFMHQTSCTSMQQAQARAQQGKMLFHSVALMHVCPRDAGSTACAMCADGNAYGHRRPRIETPCPFPLLSNGEVGDLETPPNHEELLQLLALLHPYRRLCKLTHLAFENQEKCTTLAEIQQLATNALDLFATSEDPREQACMTETCGAGCELCMEHAAYGVHRPRHAIDTRHDTWLM